LVAEPWQYTTRTIEQATGGGRRRALNTMTLPTAIPYFLRQSGGPKSTASPKFSFFRKESPVAGILGPGPKF
jgi:hypothetical protein